MLDSLSYLEQKGWQGSRKHTYDQFVRGLCPAHDDHHPSFMIDTDDMHCWCWSEKRIFTVIGLINVMEFGDQDTKDVWSACYERARELNGGTLPTDDPKFSRVYTPQAQPVPDEEQQAVLTVAMQWCHEQLWNKAAWAQASRGQRYAEKERGILLSSSSSSLRDQVQIAYAPPWNVRYNSRVQSSFESAMRQTIGSDWMHVAAQLGLIWEDTGALAIRDRILFFCTDPHTGMCIFYQGRQVEFPGVGNATAKEKKQYKYMGPRGIRKAPFLLPVARPIVPGTMHTESPVGPAVLAGYGIRSVAWMGCLSSHIDLAGIIPPHWLGEDTDEPQRLKNGTVYYPGDEQAQHIARLAEARGEAYARIRPPGGTEKDIDRWVHLQGIDPCVGKILKAYAALPLPLIAVA